MSNDLAQYYDCYLHLNADCIPVRGAVRSVVCDLTRNELIFFPDEYYDVLDYLLSDKLGIVLDGIEQEEERKMILEFIGFLMSNELVSFVKDPSMFPAIEEVWDAPAIIQNAIIDVDKIHHDFDKIFKELNTLGCRFVQVRAFSNLLGIKEINNLLSAAQHTSIESVELLLKYNETISHNDYIQLVEQQPIISSFILHTAKEDDELIANYGDNNADEYTCKHIQLLSQEITSHSHCGNISIKNLNAPTVENFFETKLYNGCLNRKISIDAFGGIKNCPSMVESYGNISNTSLIESIDKAGFKEKWNIKKDQVAVCKDCEFRYVCSDCRAYLEHPEDMYSKPLKCGYNPYTCEWEDWSSNPLKQNAITYYGRNKNAEVDESVYA